MTRKKQHGQCAGCGETEGLTPAENRLLCKKCLSIVSSLRGFTGNVGLLEEMAGVTHAKHCTEGQQEKPLQARELPDVLDAVRYRTTDRDRNTWYVSVSEMEGHPVEIFASTAFDRDQHLQSRISNLTTITRLISLILRHVFLGERITLEKTLTQLHRSSRQKNDLPDMLAGVLSNYADKRHMPVEKDIESP
ncbi:MAG: hypothetical protein F9K32_01735 [Desulfobulbaceae bacterium]|nr:MAG: hypothetical protein F9K32_01735 [Desulfobulbaceae bacterium]